MKTRPYPSQTRALFIGLQRGLCLFHQGGEGGGVVDCQLGKHLAVEGDTCLLKAVHQLGVVDAVHLGGGGDTGNPQAAEVALLLLAARKGVVAGLLDGLFGHLKVGALGAEVALCQLQDLFPSLTGHHRSFYTSHCSLPPSCCFVLEKLPDLVVGHQQPEGGQVGLIGIGGLTEASLALGGFSMAVGQMALVGLGALDLTALGELKALFGTGMCFQLGHFCFLLIGLLCRLCIQEHDHAAALQLGELLHAAELRAGLREPLHDVVAQVGVGHLPPTEADGDLHLVPAGEEAPGVPHLGFKVMGIDVKGKADLLNLGDFLVLPGLFFALGLFEAVLAVVHDTANGRGRLRGDLHKVKVFFNGHRHSVFGGDDSQLLAGIPDKPHFLVPDLLVDLKLFGRDCKAPPIFGITKRGQHRPIRAQYTLPQSAPKGDRRKKAIDRAAPLAGR